ADSATNAGATAHSIATQYVDRTPAVAGSMRADRIATIALLILGAYGVLRLSLTLMVLAPSISDLAVNGLCIDDFVVPASIATVGTVGTVVLLTLYALVLIFSIRRLRARKLTFWAPLAAGAISVILMFAFYMIALVQAPEVLQASMQPEA